MTIEDKRLKSELMFDDMIADQAEAIWHWKGYAGRIRWQRRADLIFNSISQNSSGIILEIGSGTGMLTQNLAGRLKNFSTYVSSDISLSLLKKAKKRSAQQESRCGSSSIMHIVTG